MTDAAARLDEAIGATRSALEALREQLARVVVGHEGVVDQLLIALLADGHVLLEGPPGLGKTLLVRTLASALDLGFARLQCTPDLMPSDVTGSLVIAPGAADGGVAFREGPIFTNVLLCDEVNRATPKTQSALLEAMEERHVTVGGSTRPLPDPFLLLATQNPIEMEGTYPLPEAQLDRFLLKVVLQSPSVDQLVEIVFRTAGSAAPSVACVLDADTLAAGRALLRGVLLAEPLARELAELVARTHPGYADAPEAVRRYVRFGASPRAARALALTAKGRALLAGRPHVAREDIRAQALCVLRHRLVLSFEAEAEGISADDVIAQL